ncbi:hypothetical protein GMI69_00810 [Eggerthellaceae bacterium zg-887]|nr:hypothetical protein [Xiamenia xianingshaonis]
MGPPCCRASGAIKKGTSMTILPEPLEVWLCRFRFLDMPQVKKVRPAIILEADEGALVVVAVKVTSHGPRDELGEFEVVDLESAGLLKRSTVRCSQAIELPYSDLIRPIGKLAPVDAFSLVGALEEAGITRGPESR